ncbi:hypothetical protein Scep_021491 [Stephania cephalantha]|uniref:Uncharacterized protein n=1 Tax=Stephania cephalantha TaxID=152367 RepID=A0AAP0F685_9MAGN
MGNCQAIDAASMVLQHPNGRAERLYWPVTASEVMKMHPGHYVALIITICIPDEEEKQQQSNSVRVTRVKLLKPTDILVLGQAYRLITSQEVMKGLWAKKYGKTKKKESESAENPPRVRKGQGSECTSEDGMLQSQAAKQEKHRQRTVPSGSVKSRPWQPSLESISEAAIPHQS